MKKVLSILAFSLLTCTAFADDLTAVVTNSTVGSSVGAIDLSVTGGVAPFTYSWSGPGGFTAATEDISGLAAGSYTVNVSDTYCGIASLTIVVGEDTVVAVNAAQVPTNVKIYPNPFGQELLVSFESPVTGPASLRLCDAQGRVVKQMEVVLAAHNELKLILDRPVAAGVYVLTLSRAGEVLLKADVVSSR